MSGRPQAFYNENDPFAAAWLRELIADGLIAPGVVDERSIEDVRPDELAGFTQCHFFAGIGVWSLALRQSGWPDDRPVWTGSCPCQPFSSAGQGGGFDDERHLWPAFHWLIAQCSPAIVLGEQVASKGADPWIDLVQADVEALGYAFGCLPFPVAGVGAPHIRDRAYWVADAGREAQGGRGICGPGEGDRASIWPACERSAGLRSPVRLADAMRDGAEYVAGSGLGAQAATDGSDGRLSRERLRAGVEGASCGLADRHDARLEGRSKPERKCSPERVARPSCMALGLANSDGRYAGEGRQLSGRQQRQQPSDGRLSRIERPGPTNGLWRDADWLLCRDEKWRPVEPDTFPLVDAGTFRNRVGLLRGAGNAITLGQAQEFIQAVMAWVDQPESLAA